MTGRCARTRARGSPGVARSGPAVFGGSVVAANGRLGSRVPDVVDRRRRALPPRFLEREHDRQSLARLRDPARASGAPGPGLRGRQPQHAHAAPPEPGCQALVRFRKSDEECCVRSTRDRRVNEEPSARVSAPVRAARRHRCPSQRWYRAARPDRDRRRRARARRVRKRARSGVAPITRALPGRRRSLLRRRRGGASSPSIRRGSSLTLQRLARRCPTITAPKARSSVGTPARRRGGGSSNTACATGLGSPAQYRENPAESARAECTNRSDGPADTRSRVALWSSADSVRKLVSPSELRRRYAMVAERSFECARPRKCPAFVRHDRLADPRGRRCSPSSGSPGVRVHPPRRRREFRRSSPRR